MTGIYRRRPHDFFLRGSRRRRSLLTATAGASLQTVSLDPLSPVSLAGMTTSVGIVTTTLVPVSATTLADMTVTSLLTTTLVPVTPVTLPQPTLTSLLTTTLVPVTPVTIPDVTLSVGIVTISLESLTPVSLALMSVTGGASSTPAGDWPYLITFHAGDYV